MKLPQSTDRDDRRKMETLRPKPDNANDDPYALDVAGLRRRSLRRRLDEVKFDRLASSMSSAQSHPDCPCKPGKCIYPKCTCPISSTERL